MSIEKQRIYDEIEKSLDNINAYRKFKVPNIIITEF